MQAYNYDVMICKEKYLISGFGAFTNYYLEDHHNILYANYCEIRIIMGKFCKFGQDSISVLI